MFEPPGVAYTPVSTYASLRVVSRDWGSFSTDHQQGKPSSPRENLNLSLVLLWSLQTPRGAQICWRERPERPRSGCRTVLPSHQGRHATLPDCTSRALVGEQDANLCRSWSEMDQQDEDDERKYPNKGIDEEGDPHRVGLRGISQGEPRRQSQDPNPEEGHNAIRSPVSSATPRGRGGGTNSTYLRQSLRRLLGIYGSRFPSFTAPSRKGIA